METRADVLIISAFGRGHWLAQRLAAQGRRTMIVDVTDCLGKWTSEEWEGPFPVLQSSILDDSQWQFLNSQGMVREVPGGFIIWFREGPVELRGPLAAHSLTRLLCSEESQEYARDGEKLSAERVEILKGYLGRRPFIEGWLAGVSHQLGANTFHPSFDALHGGRPAPLFSRLFTRQFTEHDVRRSLQRCEEAGARVYSATKFNDVSLAGNRLDGIEITGSRSGVLTAKKFVWTLTAAESQMLPPRVTDRFFGKKRPEAQWCWVRYRFKLSEGPERDVLPAWFLMIGDLHFPWTHANFAMVKRVQTQPEFFDIWISIPARRRFHQSFLEEMGDMLKDEWKRRIPVMKAELVEFPLEYKHGFEEMGAARFPIYDPEQLATLSRVRLRNVVYSGPEVWTGLAKPDQLAEESRLLTRLMEESENEEIKPGAHGDQPVHP